MIFKCTSSIFLNELLLLDLSFLQFYNLMIDVTQTIWDCSVINYSRSFYIIWLDGDVIPFIPCCESQVMLCKDHITLCPIWAMPYLSCYLHLRHGCGVGLWKAGLLYRSKWIQIFSHCKWCHTYGKFVATPLLSLSSICSYTTEPCKMYPKKHMSK